MTGGRSRIYFEKERVLSNAKKKHKHTDTHRTVCDVLTCKGFRMHTAETKPIYMQVDTRLTTLSAKEE